MAGIRVEAEGRTWEYQQDQVVSIGRTPNAAVVVTGPSTSRAHAELRFAEGSWTLVDLGTPHGTFVEGRRISEAMIDRPLEIRLGREADGTTARVTPLEPGDTAVDGPPASAAGPVDPMATRRVGGRVGGRVDGQPLSTLRVGWEGKERTFTASDVIRVGRDLDLDVVTSNRAVSRLHARLVVHDGTWVYGDMSSSGSYLDGRPVDTVAITRPIVLRLGDPVRGLEVRFAPSLPPPPPPAPPSLPSPSSAAAPTAPVGRGWLVGGAVLAVVLVLVLTLVGVALIRRDDPPRASDDPTTAPTTVPTHATSASTVTAPVHTPLDTAKEATVLLTATSTTGNGDQVAWQGSGSIIDASGLIMTNAHVAAPEAGGQELLYGSQDLKDPAYLKVSLGTLDDAPARPAYRARVVAVDGYVDVAILRVYATADGSALPSDLELPTVPLGDSDQLRTGDEITVLGFPGISDSLEVSVTRGTVSTFVPDERMHSDRAEIDTDARIAPGNSGGIAIDEAGDVIGIPFATRADPEVGVLSGRIRPIDFAKPVVEAVLNGTPYESPYVSVSPGGASDRG